ncbi:MAG: ferrous iron transport protein B [Candidatus Freyrarchaeum guaymaensis]
MKNLKILLIGQPNVGKSSLLNALVGPRVVVSNYPGTTVEVTQAEKVFGDTKINFVDTPGIYSISYRSEEEKVTGEALFEEEADGVIVIADATTLERSLYMTLQVLEAQIPTILVLNFVEDAEKRGIEIDYEKLEKILHVPVVPINPLKGKGMDRLVDVVSRVKKISKRAFTIKYDDDIEKLVKKVSSQVKETSIPKRFIALRILEGDEDFHKYLKDERIIEEAKESLRYHSEIGKEISISRYGTASFIVKEVTQIILPEKEKKWREKIDDALLHRIWGPIITGLILVAIFGVLLLLGNLIQGFFMDWTDSLLSPLEPDWASIVSLIPFEEEWQFIVMMMFLETQWQSIVSMILVHGLTGLAAGVSIALPYIFLFYLLLGLLEDVGLLPRLVVNAERFLKKLGLSGKAFIPLALGLGCTAPACRACRVLSCKREQICAASLFAFVPCSSRIAIIMGVVGFYGGVDLALAVFATSAVAGLVWALVLKKVVHIESKPLLLELPPYRKPLIRNVLAKSWIRMKDFVYIVIPLLVLGGITYGILDMAGLTEVIVQPFSPITSWLGLSDATIIPLVFGFLQKDLTGAMLVSVLGNEISFALTPLQIYTFGVAATIGIPCIVALGMFVKEFGFKRSMVLTITSIGYGLLVAGLVWRIISIL